MIRVGGGVANAPVCKTGGRLAFGGASPSLPTIKIQKSKIKSQNLISIKIWLYADVAQIVEQRSGNA